jgi:capsular exopolysaccharide synthesis family protein
VSIGQIAAILWRRRLSFFVTLIACVAAVVLGTLSLAKSYTATATLYVAGRTAPTSYVDTTLLEQYTRTYATLAGNPTIAEYVIRRNHLRMTRSSLLERMSFAPVERTQLLLVSADGSTPEAAQRLANVYARTFVGRMADLLAVGKAPAPIAVAEPASPPTRPAKPKPALYIGLGVLLSGFLALGVALLREQLDTRVRVGMADDTVLGEPIMVRIPRITSKDASGSREIHDRFGVLRTNLDFFDEDPARLVLVTSPGPGEGKSTTAASLALASAADGERVVLVEADLRRPGLDGTLVADMSERSPIGLSNYLAGAASDREIINVHPMHPELAVIWSGLIPPNPTALLGSHRLDELLDLLRLDYDRVIIDSCPISVGADASVIASRVDGVLYIVDEQKTKRPQAQAGLNQLRSVRARLLGVVLNRSALRAGSGYYYGSPRASRDTDEAGVF